MGLTRRPHRSDSFPFQVRNNFLLLAEARTEAELGEKSDHPGDQEAPQKEQKGPQEEG
jgi:hypothetical protein